MQHTGRMALGFAASLALAFSAGCADEHPPSHLSGGGGELGDDHQGDGASAPAERGGSDGRPSDGAATPLVRDAAVQADASVSCAVLDFATCAQTAHCELWKGTLVDESKRCLGESVAVACEERGPPRGCDDALGYVRDREGRVVMFGSLCLPTGLEQLQDSLQRGWGGYPLCTPRPQEPNRRCSELSTSQCSSDPSCLAISGMQYDAVRQCRWEQPVTVGCMQADQACPPAIVYARYPGAEEAFEIASGCIPSKFERVDYPGQIRSWPICQ